jgi:two-component system phosphate regulon sensor histidine kinase PhoR
LGKAIFRAFSQRLSVISFLFALVVFAFMGWATLFLVGYPDDGLGTLEADGYIRSLRHDGPAIDKLQVGDVILSIENGESNALSIYYPELGKHVGDTVTFWVKRQGFVIPVTIELAPPSLNLIAVRIAPILVALAFWLVGLIAGAFRPISRGAIVSFMWFQSSALALTAGAVSITGSRWDSLIFNSLLWILGPLSVHFHLYFPQTARFKGRRILLAGLYVIGLLGAFLHIFTAFSEWDFRGLVESFLSYDLLFLAFNLLAVVALLFYSYRNAQAPGARGKVRLIFLGGGLAALLFVLLTILPDFWIGQELIPYPMAFLLLTLLPLSYAYAIFRLNLIEFDRQVNRGVTYILVYAILIGFYLILFGIIDHWLSSEIASSPLVNTILALILASIFAPLHQQVQRFVDRIFYGGWYDYRLGVARITQGLELITDLRELAKMVSQRLVTTMRLEEAVVFLRDPLGDFSVIEVSLTQGQDHPPQEAYPVLPRSSLTYLLKIGAVERTTLLQALSQATISPEELQLLNTEQINLWVPVIGHGQIQGLLALGPKRGGDVFSAEDMDILRVLVQQIGPIIENIHLVTRLKNYAVELEQRVEERTAELHDAKERVEAILANVGDGVIVTDLQGCIQTVNSAFERLSGYTAQEVIGSNLFDLFTDENNVLQNSPLSNPSTRSQVWSGELVGNRKNATRYDVKLNIAPVSDRQGRTVSYVCSLSDITRQKELDRMKDMLIYDVSHELRTPITSIRLYSELLKSAPPERQERFLSVILEQSALLTRLVEDILDLSRLTISKTRKASFEETSLNVLVEQAVMAHLPVAEEAGIRLIFEPDPKLPLIHAEQSQIARMITNLLTNAIRYTSQGYVRLQTSCQDNGVRLIVEDTGMGIDPQDLPHIFERFYRGQNIRQSGIPGTGLGLAIVKEIVNLHNGAMEIESAAGKGTTFRIWLPITADESSEELPPS